MDFPLECGQESFQNQPRGEKAAHNDAVAQPRQGDRYAELEEVSRSSRHRASGGASARDGETKQEGQGGVGQFLHSRVRRRRWTFKFRELASFTMADIHLFRKTVLGGNPK